MPNILCQVHQCAACPRKVGVAKEGTEENIGVLCPTHKNEVTSLRNQLQNQSRLEQEKGTFKALYDFEKIMTEDLNEKLELVKKKLTN